MYDFRTSNKPSVFFSIDLFKKAQNEKSIVNEGWIPLIFRTDNAARDIGKRWVNDLENLSEGELFTLACDENPIINASMDTIGRVIRHWGKQSICFGDYSIKKFSECKIDESKRAEIVERIRNGAITSR